MASQFRWVMVRILFGALLIGGLTPLDAATPKKFTLFESRELAKKLVSQPGAFSELRSRSSTFNDRMNSEQRKLVEQLLDPKKTKEQREALAVEQYRTFFKVLETTELIKGADLEQTPLWNAVKNSEGVVPPELQASFNRSRERGDKVQDLMAAVNYADGGKPGESEGHTGAEGSTGSKGAPGSAAAEASTQANPSKVARQWLEEATNDGRLSEMSDLALENATGALKAIGRAREEGVTTGSNVRPEKVSKEEMDNLEGLQEHILLFTKDPNLRMDQALLERVQSSTNHTKSAGGLNVLAQLYKSAARQALVEQALELGVVKGKWSDVTLSKSKLEELIAAAAAKAGKSAKAVSEEVEKQTDFLFTSKIANLVETKAIPAAAVKTLFGGNTDDKNKPGVLCVFKRLLDAVKQNAGKFGSLVALGLVTGSAANAHAGTTPATTHVGQPPKDAPPTTPKRPELPPASED